MSFLLDTNVVSEWVKPRPDPGVVAWLAETDEDLVFLSVVTLAELRRQYSKSYARIMKRGQIKNETEYYLLRNVLFDPTEKTSDERKLLRGLISDYEGGLHPVSETR